MGNVIRTDVRQVMSSWRMVAASLGFCVLLFLSGFEAILDAARSEDILFSGFHGKLIYDALSSNVVLLALPILCTLPYGAAYIEDIKTGFVKLYISRTSRQGYALGKFAGTVLSGGLVPVVGTLVAYGISSLIFIPVEEAANSVETRWFWDCFCACGRFFLSGGFWAFFGMAMSSQMESRYISYASPFVFYYLLIILRERYFPLAYVIDPKGWLWPSEEWVLGSWSAAMMPVECMVIALLCFMAAVRKRVSEL